MADDLRQRIQQSLNDMINQGNSAIPITFVINGDDSEGDAEELQMLIAQARLETANRQQSNQSSVQEHDNHTDMTARDLAATIKQYFDSNKFVVIGHCSDKGYININFENGKCERFQEMMRAHNEAPMVQLVNEAIASIRTDWPSYSLNYVSTSFRDTLTKSRDGLVNLLRMLNAFDEHWSQMRMRALSICAQAEQTSASRPLIVESKQALLDWIRSIQAVVNDSRNQVNLLQIRIAMNEMQDLVIGARELMSHSHDLRSFYIKPIDDALGSIETIDRCGCLNSARKRDFCARHLVKRLLGYVQRVSKLRECIGQCVWSTCAMTMFKAQLVKTIQANADGLGQTEFLQVETSLMNV